MTIMVLVRHGRTRSNAEGILAGWTEGIGLDGLGVQQVERVANRLAGSSIVAAFASPLQRCQETAISALSQLAEPPIIETLDGLGECRYGAWTGRPLKELSKEPLWKTVQATPSAVRFPDGQAHPAESMQEMQDRAVTAVRGIDTMLAEEYGPAAMWVAVSHGDVIKAILADAAGIALDNFQRIVVDPASISIVRYAGDQTFLLRTNDTGSDPLDLTAQVREAAGPAADQSPVGGGAGND